ncbi:hypothetical protein MICRO116_200004 [Micrococcus sp. 116]|nr:hypothetical protein MICRO116_200004 [Micrococcus sp. 116]
MAVPGRSGASVHGLEPRGEPPLLQRYVRSRRGMSRTPVLERHSNGFEHMFDHLEGIRPGGGHHDAHHRPVRRLARDGAAASGHHPSDPPRPPRAAGDPRDRRGRGRHAGGRLLPGCAAVARRGVRGHRGARHPVRHGHARGQPVDHRHHGGSGGGRLRGDRHDRRAQRARGPGPRAGRGAVRPGHAVTHGGPRPPRFLDWRP